MSPRHERRFSGPSNAGIRKAIRDSVSGDMCAPSRRRAILSLASTVALTASGRATLAAVAEDCCAHVGDYLPGCSCDACYRRVGGILGDDDLAAECIADMPAEEAS